MMVEILKHPSPRTLILQIRQAQISRWEDEPQDPILIWWHRKQDLISFNKTGKMSLRAYLSYGESLDLDNMK